MADFDFNRYWQTQTDAHMSIATQTFRQMGPDIERLVDMMIETVRAGGKVMFCGNGGSAADAQHLAAEMSVKLKADRVPLPGLCLSLDPSAITATGNDCGFEQIFARQIQALGRREDMLIGLSTSGNSPNVILALLAARDMGMKTAGMTGTAGGKMTELCDLMIKIPSADTARIQEMHITMGHILIGALERKMKLVPDTYDQQQAA